MGTGDVKGRVRRLVFEDGDDELRQVATWTGWRRCSPPQGMGTTGPAEEPEEPLQTPIPCVQ
jgi:hypothetical protein